MEKSRYFKLEHYTTCINDTDFVDFHNFKVGFLDNVFTINSDVIVKETISEQLQLEVTVDRCETNRAQCESFDQLVIKNLCEKLDNTPFGQEFKAKVKPNLKCPIKKGNYTIEKCSLDLNLISHLPLDGFRWAVWLRIWDVSERPKKILITCLEGQVRVMLNSRRKT